MNSKFSCLIFATLSKVSGTYGVYLAIDVASKLFVFLCFVFHGAASMPYVHVQAAI